ncbi:MAG: response regulator [Motiliproteus sp.]
MTNSKRSLVILDDQKLILNALYRTFRRTEVQISTFHRPLDALSYLEKCSNVGVIISDEVMPLMRGSAFLKQAAKLHPQASRILLTGCASTLSIDDRINESNEWKLVTKPWSNGRLIEIVESGFKRYESLKNGLNVHSNSTLE